MKALLRKLDSILARVFPIVDPDPEAVEAVEQTMSVYHKLDQARKEHLKRVMRKAL